MPPEETKTVSATPVTIELSDDDSDKNSGNISQSDESADEGNQVKKLALQQRLAKALLGKYVGDVTATGFTGLSPKKGQKPSTSFLF